MSSFYPLYPYPILVIESSNLYRYLVISDLHIGFEDNINRKGVFIDPKKNVDELIESLSKVISKTQISNLIILGDLKSSTSVITQSEWENVPRFIESLAKLCNVYLIPGNHDGNIMHLVSGNVNIMSAKGMEIDNILLTHGHAIPTIGKNINKIVTGHLHPVLIKEGNIINGQKVWIKIILKKTQKESKHSGAASPERQIEFIVVPHFNKYLNFHFDFTFEYRLKGKPKLPLLNNLVTKKQWMVEEVFVVSLEGALVGAENELNKIL